VFYSHWIVDDAAISAAYARNLAEGFGLTSQPGRPPLEAFSNPLWVFLLAAAHLLGIKSLYVAPKLLGGLLVLATYSVLGRGLRVHHGASPTIIFLILGLLSLNAPLVCWLNGGLENPLMAFLVTMHVVWTLRLQQKTDAKRLLLAGLIASGLVMTRPDGLLFSILVPIGLIFRKGEFQSKVDSMALWGVGWLVPMSAYLLLRKFYFEAPWPTPFIAKESLVFTWLWDPVKWYNLFKSLAGPMGILLLPAALAAIVLGTKAKKWNRKLNIWVIHWFGAIAIFLLLPYDHLGWYRYATPFIVLSYPALILFARTAFKTLEHKRGTRAIQLSLLVLVCIGSLVMGSIITFKRFHHPPLDIEEVATRYVYPLDKLAQGLTWDTYKLYTPDAGAPLWYNRAEVYDCLGLLDTTLAFNFMEKPHRYTTYLIDSVQPDLVALHGAWRSESTLQNSPAFSESYTLLDSNFVAGAGQPRVWLWIRNEKMPDRKQAFSIWHDVRSTQ